MLHENVEIGRMLFNDNATIGHKIAEIKQSLLPTIYIKEYNLLLGSWIHPWNQVFPWI
jgi:hypothetical protein